LIGECFGLEGFDGGNLRGCGNGFIKPGIVEMAVYVLISQQVFYGSGRIEAAQVVEFGEFKVNRSILVDGGFNLIHFQFPSFVNGLLKP